MRLIFLSSNIRAELLNRIDIIQTMCALKILLLKDLQLWSNCSPTKKIATPRCCKFSSCFLSTLAIDNKRHESKKKCDSTNGPWEKPLPPPIDRRKGYISKQKAGHHNTRRNHFKGRFITPLVHWTNHVLILVGSDWLYHLPHMYLQMRYSTLSTYLDLLCAIQP